MEEGTTKELLFVTQEVENIKWVCRRHVQNKKRYLFPHGALFNCETQHDRIL